MKKKLILAAAFIMSMLIFVQCNVSDDRARMKAALRLAGGNRAELEKVLRRYSASPEDRLKYEAAVFLIGNMPYYSYLEGELLDNYME